MWEERYNSEEYIYGTEPNTFLGAISKMPLRWLLAKIEKEFPNLEPILFHEIERAPFTLGGRRSFSSWETVLRRLFQ